MQSKHDIPPCALNVFTKCRHAFIALAFGIGSLISSAAIAQTTYVQAENYSNMSGVVKGNSAAEGGQIVGSIDSNDWMTYTNINIPSSGTYVIAYRVASLNGGGSLRLEKAGTTTLYGTTAIPKTSGWDVWTTVYQTVTLTAGTQSFGLKAGIGGFNLNWFSITKSGTTASSSSTSGNSSSAPTTGGDCGSAWYKANLTTFESYPAPGSDECTQYNGCTWAGQFYGLSGKQPESWVQANNIAAVHLKDWNWLGMKTVNLRQGTKRITAKVYDACSDSDCDGCCTRNLGGDGYLVDLEKYTMQRFGSSSGIVEFQMCN